jgi:hypothetical protein
MEQRYKTGRYCGPVRLVEKEFEVNYGKGKTIFIEHMNDILAPGVTNEMIERIIGHCKEFPQNNYVFQSKNPARFRAFQWPQDSIFGTTAETNRDTHDVGNAQGPIWRLYELGRTKEYFGCRIFVTIEPVMDFDVGGFASALVVANPDFINLGADSKGHNLPEPTVEKVMALVEALRKYGIDLREKHNLQRLKAK